MLKTLEQHFHVVLTELS